MADPHRVLSENQPHFSLRRDIKGGWLHLGRAETTITSKLYSHMHSIHKVYSIYTYDNIILLTHLWSRYKYYPLPGSETIM